MNQFEDRSGWDLMIESRQYRNLPSVKNLTLRNVVDFAFLDMLSLYILYNEYETAPIALRYADKTIGYRNFSKARLSGTDLYVSMNIISDPTSVFSTKIAQNVEADNILRSRLALNLPTVKRYLDLMADNKLASNDVNTLLLRLEKQLDITDSKLRSLRRLVQEWPALTTMQKSLVTTRMLQYYKKFAKRSELSVFIEDLGKTKGYILKGPIDAELANLGLGAKDTKSWISGAAPMAGFLGGYHIGKRLFGPKDDK